MPREGRKGEMLQCRSLLVSGRVVRGSCQGDSMELLLFSQQLRVQRPGAKRCALISLLSAFLPACFYSREERRSAAMCVPVPVLCAAVCLLWS